MYHNISPRILTALVALCEKTVDVRVGAGKATASDLSF